MHLLRYVMQYIRKKIFYHRMDQDTYLRFLKENGAQIGERVRIFYPHSTLIDDTRPWMISIGDDVQITSGVRILTHGYDWSVLKGLSGNVLGSCGEVCIGNNCFIGMNTTILKGVHIGDNCIIGANSLVNKNIESGWVVAGNPAKPIMKIEDYLKKRKERQLAEALELYRCYCQRMHKEPAEEIFDEFFWLFTKRSEHLTVGQQKKMKLVGNYQKSMDEYLNSEPMFDGYNDFLIYARKCMGGGTDNISQ